MKKREIFAPWLLFLAPVLLGFIVSWIVHKWPSPTPQPIATLTVGERVVYLQEVQAPEPNLSEECYALGMVREETESGMTLYHYDAMAPCIPTQAPAEFKIWLHDPTITTLPQLWEALAKLEVDDAEID